MVVEGPLMDPVIAESLSPVLEGPLAEPVAESHLPEVEACEGQRPGTIPADFSVRACARPGCYAVFAVAAVWLARRFCTCECRRALRNVLDREARYRRRRRTGFRPTPRSSQSRPP